MKKPSIIIGKKQIIMSCLTLMLAVAVYINYATSPEIPVDGRTAAVKSDDEPIKYGETEFVNAEAAPETDDYFAQARLDKMNDRDAAVQTLQSIIGGGDITEDEMVVNALDAVQVSKLIESEGTIESLIKSQGFQDCVAYLDGETAKIVVKTEGLDKAQAASIKDIILGETDIAAENIRIFEVK
ncbi:MAG: SpoIIIAH-like family protein [Ruminococcus sp.]|uniref:SpoIIIAH-like family protein n=1 Tax=Ruminococcus sp. TaxID=41978 RepID=UPI0025FEF6CD|nr:SpoIIIAH-like family protein [Ruminococcus sp.]MCR5599371.1 SpoIIIAH-like family protein [Ruminococcus sp.]